MNAAISAAGESVFYNAPGSCRAQRTYDNLSFTLRLDRPQGFLKCVPIGLIGLVGDIRLVYPFFVARDAQHRIFIGDLFH